MKKYTLSLIMTTVIVFGVNSVNIAHAHKGEAPTCIENSTIEEKEQKVESKKTEITVDEIKKPEEKELKIEEEQHHTPINNVQAKDKNNDVKIEEKKDNKTNNVKAEPYKNPSPSINDKVNETKKKVTNHVPIDTGIVEKEGNVSLEKASKINSRISLIPSNVVNKFRASGGRVILTDKDIATTYSMAKKAPGTVAGVFKHSPSNIIYLQNSIEASTYAVIHEFGHYLDQATGFVKVNGSRKTYYGRSESDEFSKVIFPEEKMKLGNYYKTSYNSPTEYFADSFRLYVENQNMLKSIAPKTYENIRTAVYSI